MFTFFLFVIIQETTGGLSGRRLTKTILTQLRASEFQRGKFLFDFLYNDD